MITSDRQLNVTRKKLEELKLSLSAAPNKSIPSILQKSAKIQTQSLMNDLEAEIKEYEDLKKLGLKGIKISAPEDLFLLPIKFRIAKSMSQESFSHLVGVTLRQITRYEAEGYQNIQGDTFKKILSKLPITVGNVEILEKKIAS